MEKQYEKVTEVLNDGQPVKEGQYTDRKTNQLKTWQKFKVLTDSGSTYFPFGPVQIGDTLELYDDEKYGIQAKVAKQDKFATIIDKLDEILKLLRNQPTGRQTFHEVGQQIKERVEAKREAVQPKPPVDEWGNTDEYLDDEPINLADIPF